MTTTPTKRAASFLREDDNNDSNDVVAAVLFDDTNSTSDITSTRPKRIRGGGSGGGGVNNPYSNKNKTNSNNKNNRGGVSNPYASSNKKKSSNTNSSSNSNINRNKKQKANDNEDDDDLIEDYFQDGEEEEDARMDEMEPAPLNDDDTAVTAAQTVFSDITESMRQRWLRPANDCKDNSKDLSLQWLDMDMIGGAALRQNPNENVPGRRVVGASEGQVPVIRAFGVTEAGNSATVFIHGFTPYAYFALPPGSTFENTEENLTKIRRYLNNRLEGQARGGKLHEYCFAVKYETGYKSIMGYESPHTHFFKIFVAMPNLIPTLKRIMEEGVDLSGVTSVQGNMEYAPFECNVPFVLRYMIDHDVSGAGWLTLPKKTYQVRETFGKKTHCQVRTI